NIQERLTVTVQAVLRDDVAGERLPARGIGNRDNSAAGQSLGKIALALQSAGHRVVLKRAGNLGRQNFLIPEEEEFLARGFWKIDRTADVVSDGIESIDRPASTESIAEEIIGIEKFVAHVVHAHAV